MAPRCWSLAPWYMLIVHVVFAFLPLAHGVHMRVSQRVRANVTQDAKNIKVIVITVPDLFRSAMRMERLGPELDSMHFSWETVDGPNMEMYCPEGSGGFDASLDAAKELFRREWGEDEPYDVSQSRLMVFQMATLVGHMRAWKRIVSTNAAAIILEDDAEITEPELLVTAIQKAETDEDNVCLLDARHCLSEPPDLDPHAPGLTGYWLDPVAAQLLLDALDFKTPIDWQVNKIFNEDLKAVCSTEPELLREYGGEGYARTHSAAKGCGGGSVDLSLVETGKAARHPVAEMLAALVHKKAKRADGKHEG